GAAASRGTLFHCRRSFCWSLPRVGRTPKACQYFIAAFPPSCPPPSGEGGSSGGVAPARTVAGEAARRVRERKSATRFQGRINRLLVRRAAPHRIGRTRRFPRVQGRV